VKKYLAFLIEKEKETNGCSSWNPSSSVSPLDWSIICRSILLMRCDKHVQRHFAAEFNALEDLLCEATIWKSKGFEELCGSCTNCGGTLEKTKKDPSNLRCKPCMRLLLSDELHGVMACCYCGNQQISTANPKCANCKYTHENLPNYQKWLGFNYDDDGIVVPHFPEDYAKIIHINTPKSMDDPQHFAHPLRKLCEFLDSGGQAI